jgi:hypothetical protein
VELEGKNGQVGNENAEKKMFEPHMQKADRYRTGTDITPRILVNHHQRLPCLASSLSGANSMAVSYTSIAFWI